MMAITVSIIIKNIYHLYKSKFTSFAAPTMALAADGEDDEDDEAGAEESHPRYC